MPASQAVDRQTTNIAKNRHAFGQLIFIAVHIASYFKPYRAGTDFSRQNLTSLNGRFRRLKSIPALMSKFFIKVVDHNNIGIQIKRKELNKTFVMI